VTVGITIEGLQKAQRANAQAIAAVKPSGGLGKAIQYGTTQAHRWAVYYTPWDTGGLRAAHRMEFSGARGKIYIDPGARNPRQRGAAPSEYGFYLHQQGLIPGLRGGVRAFYAQTVEAKGQTILEGMGKVILGELP